MSNESMQPKKKTDVYKVPSSLLSKIKNREEFRWSSGGKGEREKSKKGKTGRNEERKVKKKGK